MNLRELKKAVDTAIEALGETSADDVQVNVNFDLDMEVDVITPSGKVLNFKERTFELENLGI